MHWQLRQAANSGSALHSENIKELQVGGIWGNTWQQDRAYGITEQYITEQEGCCASFVLIVL
jgi:hypothetical protein